LKLLVIVDELNIQTLVSCLQGFLIENRQEFLNQDPIGILDVTYQSELFSDLWDYCLKKICEKPETLINSKKFTSLNLNIMKVLFKRDDFYLDEIVIWENLIKWCLARNSINSQDVKNWDKEISSMRTSVCDFIPLIRFHHISSEDFFNKVLPFKKLLPKELLNEIIEFHMVSKKLNDVEMEFPRQSNLINYDTVLIISRHFDIFASWIDKKEGASHYNSTNNPYKFELLYRASRDGMNDDSFHEKCDDKPMTIILAKIKDSEQIVGGYNPLQWDKNQGYKTTSDSFIFSFKIENSFQLQK